MDEQTFATISAFLKSNSGLTLTQEKAYLLKSRLTPILGQHKLNSLEELATRLQGFAPENLRQDVIEAMTTNETSFFRDLTPFETFKNYVIPELMEKRKVQRSIRILCAAASSGQEPYSLAMSVADLGDKCAGWNVQILGVDLDTKMLKRAEEGVYSQFEVQRGLPVQNLVKYFDSQPNQSWRVKDAVRGMVRYRACNLLKPFAELGQFDVIFCRNVLIYFDTPTKKDVLERLSGRLPSDGYLFLGGAETVIDITDRFAPSPGKRGLYMPQAAPPLLNQAV